MTGLVQRHGLLQGQGLDLGPYTLRYAPGERTMLRVLADRAADRPDKDWVVFDSRDRLTFGGAWEQACRAGHAFDRDLPAGAHVGLLMRNQPEFLVSFYGALVRGGIAVPLNAESRGPLLHAVIEHSDVQAIVVRDELVERLTALPDLGHVRLVVVVGDGPAPAEIHGARVVRFADWLEGAPTHHAWPFPPDDEYAAIMYTSGTTARPKGAVYTHQFLYLYASLGCDSQERTEDDVLTAPLPLYHAAALHVISNACLHVGCTGHLKSRFSASQYWQQCADDGATWGVLLGPMSTMILKMTQDPVPAHRVQRIYCPPPPPDLAEFERRFAPVQIIWWGFGMTEIFPMPPIMPELHDRTRPMDTIGRPSRWMDYGVVDEHDRLLPPNEIGELVFRPCIPHAMVSEYYKDPERTVEAFRNLMFHTGDLALYDDDGILHFRSRKQDQDPPSRRERVGGRARVGRDDARVGARRGGVRRPERARRGGRQARRRPARAGLARRPARVARREPPALHGAALPGDQGHVPEDAERADREVQAAGGLPRPARGLRHRAWACRCPLGEGSTLTRGVVDFGAAAAYKGAWEGRADGQQAPAAPPVRLTAPFRAGETSVTTEARAHD